jgi:hypothetical protein
VFTAIVLICFGFGINSYNCYTQTHPFIFETRDDCESEVFYAIQEGFFEFEDTQFGKQRIVNFACIDWSEAEV